MSYRKVGASGLEVSALGLGTLTWGREVELKTARNLLRTFISAGGNLIDTAPVYADGLAEKFVGKIVATDWAREDVILASKAGFVVRDGDQQINTSRSNMLDQLATTLRHLGTDYLDLWQVHAWGDAPLDETLAAIDQAVSSGMVRYAGVCNFVGWQIGTAATWQSAQAGRTPLISTQVEYSLLARRAEVEIIPASLHHGMGIFPWSPIGRGVLTGKYLGGTPRSSRGAQENFAWFVEPYLQPRSRAIVEATVHAADGLGLTPAQVAFLWVRDAPGVTAPLLGARTPEQLQTYLELDSTSLPAPIIDALDDITGGPNLLRS